MSRSKLGKWLNDNIVMLVGIPLIVGVHYGWGKIQDIPYLVEPAEKKELPIIAAFKSIKNKLAEKLYLKGNTSKSED